MKKRYSSFEEYLENEYKGPYSATDIIIRHDTGSKKGIVLIERKYYPKGLALPGGMAERMPFPENAVKESMEETGLEVVIDEPNYKPLCVFSDVEQDPRAFIASIAYTAEGRGVLRPRPEEDAKSAAVYSLEEIAYLLGKDVWAFKHHQIVMAIYLQENIAELSPEHRRMVADFITKEGIR